MKSIVFAMLAAALLSGCAERYFNGSSAEALVYPETHVYQFTVKSGQQTTSQISSILDIVEENDSGASYLLEYRNTKGKKVLDGVMKGREKLPLRAEAFSLRRNSTLSNDIQLTITYHSLLTQPCQPSEIEEGDISRNCFSEVARMKQISHKERLVEGL